MTPFTESAHCLSRAHCQTCRTNAAWRAAVGAPETCPHDPALPSTARMAANYLAAQATDLLAGRPRRTPAEARTIYQTHCNPPGAPCEHYRPSDSRCSLCGCPVKDKIPMRRQHCPAGKW